MSLHEAIESPHTPTLVIPGRWRRRRPPRVLIVDDLAENRLVLRLYCDQFGFSHDSVASGHEAVEAARSGRFDVVLMDILMPGMDGFAATQAIRALPEPISSVPIIAVTTAAAPGEVLRYLAFGMTGVVAKPISITRLAEALSAALAPPKREAPSGRAKALAAG